MHLKKYEEYFLNLYIYIYIYIYKLNNIIYLIFKYKNKTLIKCVSLNLSNCIIEPALTIVGSTKKCKYFCCCSSTLDFKAFNFFSILSSKIYYFLSLILFILIIFNFIDLIVCFSHVELGLASLVFAGSNPSRKIWTNWFNLVNYICHDFLD